MRLPQINPYLLDPIPARVKYTGERVGVLHVVGTLDGVYCLIEYASGKSGQALVTELAIEDAGRFRDLRARESV